MADPLQIHFMPEVSKMQILALREVERKRVLAPGESKLRDEALTLASLGLIQCQVLQSDNLHGAPFVRCVLTPAGRRVLAR